MMQTPYSLPAEKKTLEDALCNEIRTLERMAQRLTSNAFEAEDLVQETLVLALRFSDSFAQNTNLRAWLYRVMRNRHISSARRSRLERKTYETEAYHILQDRMISEMGRRTMEDGGGVETESGFSDSVVHALDGLNPTFREAIWLCDISGLSYAEAAKHAACPIGTIMSRLHRGRRALRRRLDLQRELEAA